MRKAGVQGDGGVRGGRGGRRVGLLPLQAAVDSPRPVVLCPVEGMLRSDQNKHIPPSPHPIRQSAPWEPEDEPGSGRGFRTPAPAPHWETQGTQRTKPLPRSLGWTRPGLPWGVQQARLCAPSAAGTGPAPLAGDLLWPPHPAPGSSGPPRTGKSQQGHTKSGNSHHALKGWGRAWRSNVQSSDLGKAP